MGKHKAVLRRGGAYREPLRGVEKNEGPNPAYERFLSQSVVHAEDKVVEVLRCARAFRRREEEEKKKKELERERRRHPVLKLMSLEEEKEEQQREEKKNLRYTDTTSKQKGRDEDGKEELRDRGDGKHEKYASCRGEDSCKSVIVSRDSSSEGASSCSTASPPSASPPSESSLPDHVADLYFSHVHSVRMIAPSPQAFRDLHVKHLLLPSFSPNHFYPASPVLSLSPLAQVERKVLQERETPRRRPAAEIEEAKSGSPMLPQGERGGSPEAQDEEETSSSPPLLPGRRERVHGDFLPFSCSSCTPPHEDEEGRRVGGRLDSSAEPTEKGLMASRASPSSLSLPQPLSVRTEEAGEKEEGEQADRGGTGHDDEEVVLKREPWRRELVEEHSKVLAGDIKAPGLLQLQSQVREDLDRATQLFSCRRKHEVEKRKEEEERSPDDSSLAGTPRPSLQQQYASSLPSLEGNEAQREPQYADHGSPVAKSSSSHSAASSAALSSQETPSSSTSSFALCGVEENSPASSTASPSSFSRPLLMSESTTSSSSSLVSASRWPAEASVPGAPSLVLAAANARMRDRLVCQSYRRNRTNEDFPTGLPDGEAHAPFSGLHSQGASASSSSFKKELLVRDGQTDVVIDHAASRRTCQTDKTSPSSPSCFPRIGRTSEAEEEDSKEGGAVPVDVGGGWREKNRSAHGPLSENEQQSSFLPREASIRDSTPSTSSGKSVTRTSDDSSLFPDLPGESEMDFMSEIFEEALEEASSSCLRSEGTASAQEESPCSSSSVLSLRDEAREASHHPSRASSASPSLLGRRSRRARRGEEHSGRVCLSPEGDTGEASIVGGNLVTRRPLNEGVVAACRGGFEVEDPEGPCEVRREILLGGEQGERDQQEERGRRREFDVVWTAQCAGLEGAEKLGLPPDLSATEKSPREGTTQRPLPSETGRKQKDGERSSAAFLSSFSPECLVKTPRKEGPSVFSREQEGETRLPKTESVNEEEGYRPCRMPGGSPSSKEKEEASGSKANVPGQLDEVSLSEVESRTTRETTRENKEAKKKTTWNEKEAEEEGEGEREQQRHEEEAVVFEGDDQFELSRKIKRNETLLDFWQTEGGAGTVFDNYNGCILPVQTGRYVVELQDSTPLSLSVSFCA